MDPISGPIPLLQFRELIDLPFGRAAAVIQRYDPEWGRRPGEKFEWKVEVRRADQGVAYIKAASQEEADRLADDLVESDIDWDNDGDDFTIVSVEPKVG